MTWTSYFLQSHHHHHHHHYTTTPPLIAYQLGDEYFSDHQTMEILFYDLILNEIVSFFFSSGSVATASSTTSTTSTTTTTSATTGGMSGGGGETGGSSVVVNDELIQTWADTLKKLCKPHRDVVRNSRIFKGFILQLKDSSSQSDTTSQSDQSNSNGNRNNNNNTSEDIPAYWAKRWCVVTEEFLFLYSHRKSPLPECAFILKKISLPGVTNMEHALPHYKTLQSISDSIQNENNEWINLIENTTSGSSHTLLMQTLSGDEKNLCFALNYENGHSGKSNNWSISKQQKHHHSHRTPLCFFLANNDQQKESLFEMIQINSGLIKIGSSEEERLLEKLGLPIHEHDNGNMESGHSSSLSVTTPSSDLSISSSSRSSSSKDSSSEGIGKIQVWPISDSISQEDLQDLFGVFGPIDHIELFSKEHRAVLTFHKKSSALNALVLHHTNLDATKINVQALSDEHLYEPGYLKVENISPQCSKQDIRVIFATFGEIQKIKLWRDPNSLNHSFCGIIKFKTVEQAKMGLVFNGSKLYYEEIKVTLLEGNTSSSSMGDTFRNSSGSNYNSIFGEEKLFNNEYDPNEVKANRQKVLIQIKGDKKIRSRQVELSPKSINSGDVFLLDCGSVIYVWNGKQTSRFKKARGLDVATNLKLKERGGNAKIIIIDEGQSVNRDEQELERQFWNTLFTEYGDPSFSREEFLKNIPDKKAGGDDKEFEEKLDKNTVLYRINFTEHQFDFSNSKNNDQELPIGKYQLKIVHRHSQPALSDLNSNFVYVLDCLSEIYIWEGKYSSKAQRVFGRKFASKIEQQDHRPIWTRVCKIVEHSEPILFKEKMSDYAGVLPIAVSQAAIDEKQGKGNVAQRKEQHVIDVNAMMFIGGSDSSSSGGNVGSGNSSGEKDSFSTLPREPMFHEMSNHELVSNARNTSSNYEIFIWKVEGFEKVDYDEDYYGQLYSGDSFVILFKYYKSNKAKHIIYFWQGRDCSTNEKGASALLTIDVSNINLQGDDAPQIRIIQQKETRHFLSMFHSYLGLDGLVIPLGKFAIDMMNDSSSSSSGNSSLTKSHRLRSIGSSSSTGTPTNNSTTTTGSSSVVEESKRVFQQALSQLYIYDIRCVKSPIAKNKNEQQDQNSVLYCEKTKAIQVDTNEFKSIEQIGRLFNSNHTLLIVTKDRKEGYLWKGKYHHQEKEVALARHVANHVLKFPDSKLIQMDQNAEKDFLWKLFGLNAMNAAPIKKFTKSQLDQQKKRIDPILYQFSGATGVVDVERVYNYSQDDLDIFSVFLLDAQELGCFLWFGSHSSHNLQKIALDTSLRYCMTHYGSSNNKNNTTTTTGEDVNLYVTYTGQEPASFKTHFHAWGAYRDKYIVNYLNSSANNSKEVLIPASDMMKEYARKTYSYKTLLSEQLPAGVNATKLEEYLSNEEFQLVFNMTRDEFNQLPKWKQESEKRKVYLF